MKSIFLIGVVVFTLFFIWFSYLYLIPYVTAVLAEKESEESSASSTGTVVTEETSVPVNEEMAPTDSVSTPVVPNAEETPAPAPTPKPTPTPTPTPAPQQPTASGYTAAMVATHNDESSCWSIVNGKVYDLTSFIGKHPGGERNILKICGKDGTAAFMGQHGGEGGPESTLAKHYLGAFVE